MQAEILLWSFCTREERIGRQNADSCRWQISGPHGAPSQEKDRTTFLCESLVLAELRGMFRAALVLIFGERFNQGLCWSRQAWDDFCSWAGPVLPPPSWLSVFSQARILGSSPRSSRWARPLQFKMCRPSVYTCRSRFV